MAEESNGRITVSRDALRADLSDLKNELKDYISTQLERKADTSEVRSMSEAVRSLTDWSIRAQRGEFTEAQKNTVERWMDKILAVAEKKKENAGPWLLAHTLHCPVYFVAGVYTPPNHYALHFELLADEVRLDRKDRAASLARYVRAYAAMLETFARSASLNWFNFFDFWSRP